MLNYLWELSPLCFKANPILQTEKKKKNEAEEKLSKITHLVKRDRIQTEVDSFYVLYVTPRANPFV